jgi:hypothetical protein
MKELELDGNKRRKYKASEATPDESLAAATALGL